MQSQYSRPQEILPFFYSSEESREAREQIQNHTVFNNEVYSGIKEINDIANELEGRNDSVEEPRKGLSDGFLASIARSFSKIIASIAYAISRMGINNVRIGNDYQLIGVNNRIDQSSTHVTIDQKENKKENNKNNNKLIFGFAMAAITGVGSYLGGVCYKSYHKFQTRYQYVNQFKTYIEINCSPLQLLQKNHLHAVEIHKIAEKAKQVLENTRKNALINCAITATIVAGAAIAAIGTVVASSSAMTVGGIAVGLGGGVALFKWGMGSLTEEMDQKSIKEIHTLFYGLINARTQIVIPVVPLPTQQPYY